MFNADGALKFVLKWVFVIEREGVTCPIGGQVILRDCKKMPAIGGDEKAKISVGGARVREWD